MITFKREEPFCGKGGLKTAEVLGITVQESEAYGLTFSLSDDDARSGTGFTAEEMRFLLALVLFLGQTVSEAHQPNHLASWLEGYRTGQKSLQPIAYQKQMGARS